MKSAGFASGRFIFIPLVIGIFLTLFSCELPTSAVELLTVRDAALAPPVGANGDSVDPRLSPDGRFVVFSSAASDLVTNDNGWLNLDVFLRDRVSNLTTLISENLARTGGGDGHSVGKGVSTNGHYVLFESQASDLVNGDTNQLADVFVRDCQTQTTILVSVSTTGGAGNSYSQNANMTPDGRFVAFVSYATDLVAGDTNGSPDVFVRDLQSHTTKLVSVGATNANATMGTPSISADGRWVAFWSSARGLVADVPGTSRGEIYLRDLATGTTLWPSTNAVALVRSNLQFTSTPVPMHPVLSQDGRYVTFACGWTNNATTPPNGTTPAAVVLQFDAQTQTTTVIETNAYPPAFYKDEIYGPEATPDGRFVVYAGRVTNGVSSHCNLRRWDRQTDLSVAVSVDTLGGVATNRTSAVPALSADGRYVLFLSDATNLVNNVISNGVHLYRRDLQANTTALVDVDLDGVGSMLGFAENFADIIPVISADGSCVAYSAPDGKLVAADDNAYDDVFVWDGGNATNEMISGRLTALVPRAGNLAALPGLLSLSADGNQVAYTSAATNLVAADVNRGTDVYVWDRIGLSNQVVSVGMDGLPARGGASIQPQISADGRYVLFVSGATNLVAADNNGKFDVFLRDLQLQVTVCVSLMTNGVSLGASELQMTAMTPDAWRVVLQARTNATGATYPIFWRDLMSGETRLVASNPANTWYLSLSTNGNRVAYSDNTLRLAVWDAPSGTIVYSTTASVTSAVLSPSGRRVLYQSAGQVYCYDLDAHTLLNAWPSIIPVKNPMPWSPDERYVIFVTPTALVASDNNAVNDVYLCDLQTGTLSLISSAAAGTASGSDASDVPGFSADGRFIAYRSFATNLLAQASAAPGLFVFDRVTGSNRLVVARSTVPGPAWVSWPVISRNGDLVAFKSLDAGLVAGDLNQTVDAFASAVSVLSTSDSDGDGIPDWWLQRYFGHAAGQSVDLSRPSDDADGDGLTNLQEFLAGTNPTDSTSALEVQISLTPPTGTNVVLSWPAQTGKNYRVQFRDDTAAGTWQNLAMPVQVVGGQGRVLVTRTNQTRMFRVRSEE